MREKESKAATERYKEREKKIERAKYKTEIEKER